MSQETRTIVTSESHARKGVTRTIVVSLLITAGLIYTMFTGNRSEVQGLELTGGTSCPPTKTDHTPQTTEHKLDVFSPSFRELQTENPLLADVILDIINSCDEPQGPEDEIMRAVLENIVSPEDPRSITYTGNSGIPIVFNISEINTNMGELDGFPQGAAVTANFLLDNEGQVTQVNIDGLYISPPKTASYNTREQIKEYNQYITYKELLGNMLALNDVLYLMNGPGVDTSVIARLTDTLAFAYVEEVRPPNNPFITPIIPEYIEEASIELPLDPEDIPKLSELADKLTQAGIIPAQR